MLSSITSKFKNKRRTNSKVYAPIVLLLAFTIFLLLPLVDSSQAYVIIIDNNVDADSDVDTTSNIGNDYATDYTDAQTLDGSDQEINESSSGGGGSTFEDYIDLDDSDVDSTPDLGELTNFNNMKASDSSYANLSEAAALGEIQITQAVVEDFNTPTATSHTLSLSTASTGDLRLIIIAANPDGTGTVPSINLPSGWNWAGTQTNTGAASDGMLGAIYRIVQGGDGTTLATTYTQTCMVASICITYEGVDQSTPLDQTVPTYDVTENPPTSPAITTQTDGAWVVRATLVDGAPGFSDSSIPSGTTLRGTMVNNPPSNGQNLGVADEIQVTAGDAGSADWSGGGTEEAVSLSIALRPATGSTDFQMDQEVQFTYVNYFLPTQEVCIETGSFGSSEDINVTIWSDSSAWVSLASDLTASSWNNFTVLINSSTFTIKFGGSTTSSDSTEDYWLIDAVLLQLSGAGSTDDPVDSEDSNIDSAPDNGTLTNFANLATENDVYATFEETSSAGTVVLENSAQATTASIGLDTLTYSYALQQPSGNNRLLVVQVVWEDATTSAVSTFTCDGTAMVAAIETTVGTGYSGYTGIWYMLDANLPSSAGSYNLIITLTEVVTNDIWFGVLEYSGVHQAAPDDTDGNVNTAAGDVSVTTNPTSADSFVIVAGMTGGTQFTGNTGAITVVQEATPTSSAARLADSDSYTLPVAGFTCGFTGGGTRESLSVAVWHTASGSDDYQLDQELQFSGVLQGLTATLTINTGTMGTENIIPQVWNATDSAWISLDTDLDGSSWNNYTITNHITSSNVYIQLIDGTKTSDTTTQDNWLIDYIGLNLENQGGTNYRLEWEHQVQSLDIHKDRYIITIYGHSTSDTEEFDIEVWNHGGSSWSSPLTISINETEMWYNQSVDFSYVDTATQRLTWRYVDDIQSSDSVEDRLSIDYAGVRAYNISIYGLPDNHDSLTFSPDDEYHALTDSPFTIVVESGEIYSLQIKGVDGTGSPVSGGYLFWNTVDNTGTATQLTTSWVDLLTSQPIGNNTHNVYLWVNYNWVAGDPAINDITPTYTLNITISGV